MALSKAHAQKIQLIKKSKERIQSVGKLRGVSSLVGAPAFVLANSLMSSAVSPFLSFLISPLVGLSTAYTINNINLENHVAFRPTPIDSSYRQQPLKDAHIHDRLFMGLGMRLDDYKAGLEVFEEMTGETGADAQKAYQAARAHDYYPTFIPDEYLTRHAVFMGQTGVGKTEAQLAMLQQSIARGGGGLMIEMKGDGSLPARAYQLAKAYGAEKRFRLINLNDPEISMSYSPVGQSGENDSDISAVMAVLSSDGEQFHQDVSKWTLNVAITVINGQPGKPTYTLSDIFYLISDIEVFHDTCLKMSERTVDEQRAKIFAKTYFKQFTMHDREGNEIWNISKYTDRVMGVIAGLQSFIQGKYASVLNTNNPQVRLKESIENGDIVIVSANTLTNKQGAETFGRLLMADLGVAIGQIQQQGTKPLVTFPVWLDEYGSFKHSFQETLFQLARSANVGLIVGIQGFGFLKGSGKGDQTFAENVLANCWNHIFFDIRDLKTREICAGLAGTAIKYMEQTSESESEGQSNDKSQSTIVGNQSKSKSVSSGFKGTREDEVQANDLKLEAGDALWVGKHETYRMRLPIIEFEDDAPDLKDVWHEMEILNFPPRNKLGVEELMIRTG